MTIPRIWLVRGLTILLAGLVILLWVFDPQVTNWFPPCPFRALTGLDCPGCGSARGLHSLLHGQWIRAADHNILLYPALAFLTLALVHSNTGRGARIWNLANRPKIILWVILVYWVMRNLPWMPLLWLGSGIEN